MNEPEQILEVAASEFDLVTVARSIVGLGAPAPTLLRAECPLAPPSPACVAILRETIAKGCVRRLAVGGWQVRDRVRAGGRVSGRLWQRHPAPDLVFGEASEELLRWMTEHSLVLAPPLLKRPPETAGDDLFFYLAMAAAVSAGVGKTLAAQPALWGAPLCWLGFVEELAAAAPSEVTPPDFSRLADGLLVEALEDELARRWISIERSKGEIVTREVMIALGTSQARVLDAFFAAIDAAGRRDLAEFVVAAAAELGSGNPTAATWVGELAGATRLSERQAARVAAASFLAALETPAAWAETARTAHFIDDDYAAAQILLEIWEMLGSQRLSALRAVHHEMTSIEAVTGEAVTGEAPTPPDDPASDPTDKGDPT